MFGLQSFFFSVLLRSFLNNPVKKTVNYWQLWLPASYRNCTVCYCFCVRAYSC